MLRRWFTVRVLEPLKAQLTQGVSPVRLAVALALGLTLGTFPVLGTTTALCALAALGLRLNQPAIQVANYLAYPLQLAAYLPLFAAGAALFGAPPVTFTLAAPALMTFLLVRVSGVALLEQDIGQRRPGYREYVRRTSAFFPWFPKQEA